MATQTEWSILKNCNPSHFLFSQKNPVLIYFSILAPSSSRNFPQNRKKFCLIFLNILKFYINFLLESFFIFETKVWEVVELKKKGMLIIIWYFRFCFRNRRWISCCFSSNHSHFLWNRLKDFGRELSR